MLQRHCSLEAGNTYNLTEGEVVNFILSKGLGVRTSEITGELKLGRQLPTVVLRKEEMTNPLKIKADNE